MTPTNTTTPRGCRAGRRSRRGRGAALRPVAPLTARDPAARQRERGVRDLIQLQGLARSTVRAHLARPRAGGVPADGPGLDLRAHVRSSFLDVLTVPPRRPGDQRVTREEATVGYGWGPAAVGAAPLRQPLRGRPTHGWRVRLDLVAKEATVLCGGPELLLGGKVSWWTAKNPAGERPERAYRPRHP